MVVGDFDADGQDDLAVTSQGSGEVSVMPGDGAGRFFPTRTSPAGGFPSAIAVGDFNNDDFDDLVVPSPSGIFVLTGDGTGLFLPPSRVTDDADADAAVVEQLNGDDHQDVAVSSKSTGTVGVLLGDGQSLSAPVRSPAGLAPASIATEDFNGDGLVDLVVSNATTNQVTVLLGNGLGAFGRPLSFGVGREPRAVGAGDFNSDGWVDIVTANGTDEAISVLLNARTGSAARGTVENAKGRILPSELSTPTTEPLQQANSTATKPPQDTYRRGESCTARHKNPSGRYKITAARPNGRRARRITLPGCRVATDSKFRDIGSQVRGWDLNRRIHIEQTIVDEKPLTFYDSFGATMATLTTTAVDAGETGPGHKRTYRVWDAAGDLYNKTTVYRIVVQGFGCQFSSSERVLVSFDSGEASQKDAVRFSGFVNLKDLPPEGDRKGKRIKVGPRILSKSYAGCLDKPLRDNVAPVPPPIVPPAPLKIVAPGLDPKKEIRRSRL